MIRTPDDLTEAMLEHLLPRVDPGLRREFIHPAVLAEIERQAAEQCLHTCAKRGADDDG